MGGGLLQIVAYGSQDTYLTSSPQISFWKMVYRRYTNFSMEAVDQSFTGSGLNQVATISRNGDLIHKCWLEFDQGTTSGDLDARNLIDSVELEIGGQQIDKQSGAWMKVWDELTCAPGKTMTDLTKGTGAGNKRYVPLHFFFCQNPGLALPIIALQYHEIRIKVNLSSAKATHVNDKNFKLWVDYVYLDTDERRRMAQSSHELLITQVQEQKEPGTGTTGAVRLNFNHPCKEVVWSNTTPLVNRMWNLKLNGHDRMAPREERYFNKVQPYQHHTNLPANTCVYSFCLKPEEAQPSGSCNFSRIDNAQLVWNAASGNGPGGDTTNGKGMTVWATNWNVLRIMSGMGGLAYSN